MVVNDIFKSKLKDRTVKESLCFAQDLLSFLDFIIKADICLPHKEYVAVNDKSFSYADNYVKCKHSQYYQEFKRMWKDNEIVISDYGVGNASCDSYTGKIFIGQSNTVLDDLFLVHEFFHHQNLRPINKNSAPFNSLSRKLFGEAISIMAQLDFAKSLTNDSLLKDSKIFELDYVNDCVSCAKKARVELILIDIFNSCGDVSDYSVEKYLSTCNDQYLKELVASEYEKCLRDICGWGANLKFLFNLKYVLGVTVGYYLADLVEKDPNKWNDIYYINSNFYDIDINTFFDRIGTTLDNEHILLNFLEHYKTLKDEASLSGDANKRKRLVRYQDSISN